MAKEVPHFQEEEKQELIIQGNLGVYDEGIFVVKFQTLG